jgi:hypothetical protein
MTHVCDSTTILMLYIAENDYGYQPMMDISTFEKGQYAPLFDMMMANMEEGEMMEEEPMAEEETMMEEEAMAEGEMGEDMMMLAPATIPDEDPACTELRASVESFIYDHFAMEMMAAEDGG